jgi:hypothetical protein
MKNGRKANGANKQPVFVARAQRAFTRVARKLRTENRKLGLMPLVWPNGKRSQRGSLKNTKAMEVFVSERRRERAL